ncbi:MAG: TadE/TadG family type IV pilus assembly protein [Actinomycetota bacterium]
MPRRRVGRSRPADDTAEGNIDGDLEQGNALAEFALVLPLLMMFVFGLVELGFALTASQAVESAAREGGRLASLSSTTTADVIDRVDASLAGAPIESDPVVSVSPSVCAGREGESVSVTVSGTRRIDIPFVLDRNVTLTGEAVFRCEA